MQLPDYGCTVSILSSPSSPDKERGAMPDREPEVTEKKEEQCSHEQPGDPDRDQCTQEINGIVIEQPPAFEQRSQIAVGQHAGGGGGERNPQPFPRQQSGERRHQAYPSGGADTGQGARGANAAVGTRRNPFPGGDQACA